MSSQSRQFQMRLMEISEDLTREQGEIENRSS